MQRGSRLRFVPALAILLFCLPGALAADQACEDQCWANFSVCNCYDYWSCAACDEQRDQCYQSCAYCPSTRDYSTTTVLSRTPTYLSGCYKDHLNNSGNRRYYEYSTTARQNNYRETTQCNGSKSTQLLSSNTYSYNCWIRGYSGADVCSNRSRTTLPLPMNGL